MENKQDYKLSINLLENMKKELIENLNNVKEIDEKISLLDKIKHLDEQLYFYNKITTEEKIIGKFFIFHFKIDTKNTKIENKDSNNLTSKLNKENKKIKNTNNIENPSLKNLKEIKYYDEQLNLNIIYSFQSSSKNYNYYKCKRRPKCQGTAKMNIITKEIEITKKCDININHDYLNYEQFKKLYKSKDFSKVDLLNKKYQKYFLKLFIKENENCDIPEIISKFEKLTGKKLKLSSHEISQIRSDIFSKYNKMNLMELIENIKDDELDIEIKSSEMKYKYKNIKGIIEEREQKIIVFGNKEGINYLDNEKAKEYFVDTTFKIIPKKFRPNKLLTITTLLPENTTKICCFIIYKYQDKESYERILLFLKNNYNFNPQIIHTDYEYSLYSAFANKNIYNYEIYQIYCFFHYIKAIKEKMLKFKLTKSKLNKKAYNIIKNIEILSFINQKNLKIYIKLIEDKLSSDKNYKKLIPYLKKNWFSTNPDLFNYSKLLEIVKKK